MYFTDDPIADFERHEAEADEWLNKRPTCQFCGEPIQDEMAIYYHDRWTCKECELDFWNSIRKDFMESVED